MARETTWAITDENGTTVLSGGPYTNNNNTPISESTNLDPGCYTFTINDSYGDGICCAYGTGSYSFPCNAALKSPREDPSRAWRPSISV